MFKCRDVFFSDTGAKGDMGNPGVKGDIGPVGECNRLCCTFCTAFS